MGLFDRISGILGGFFQLGGPSGPGLANDGGSGNIGAYNPSQAAYVTVRAADPVVANDLVTLEYAQANFGAVQDSGNAVTLFFQEYLISTGATPEVSLPGSSELVGLG